MSLPSTVPCKAFLGLVLGLLLVLVPWGAADAFTDVDPAARYAEAIADLSDRGVIDGYPDGSFKPSEPLLRMQFAKMIVRALGLPVSRSDVCLFTDVPEDLDAADPLYPDNYVAVCASRGITRGTTLTTFAPFVHISRQQLITMVARAASLPEPPVSFEPPFQPKQFSLPDHYANARRAAYHGLLVGLGAPDSNHSFCVPASRGEVCLLLYNLLSPTIPPGDLSGPVTNVIDGDTIRVRLGGQDNSVRLLGVDTPETGEPFAAEATAALSSLVAGETVRLETDVQEYDQYGRLLAYVWVEDGRTWQMTNETMLLLGLATIYTVPPNVKYVERLRRAQGTAQATGAGVWGTAGTPPLEIVSVDYDAPGNDNSNLNEEYVTFRVLVSGSLIGYAVEDQTGHRYEFADRVFQRDQVFRLRTGAGTDTQTDLYWGKTGTAVWNNAGDTVKVLDYSGHIVTSYSY